MIRQQPSSSPRRQLSRTIPWQLPLAALLVICALSFLILQPLRARNSTKASKETETTEDNAGLAGAEEGQQSVVVTGTLTTSAESVLLIGDPFDDPAVRPSELEDVDQVSILLLGTDGRDEEDGPPRTDLMMLLLLNRVEQRATLISIPRDLWVPIPGYGEGKINTAYFLGSLEERGPELARETVEELVGFPVNHTVQIDFNGFRELVDTLGGIEIDVPEAIDDPFYPDGNYGTLHLQIPAGPQHMDGETALRYARTRYGSTDQARSGRQQAVLLALRERALQPAQLARAPLLLRTAYRTVESDLALGDFFELARVARSLDPGNISMHTLNEELTWSAMTWNGLDALFYEPETLRAAIAAWAKGEEPALTPTP